MSRCLKASFTDVISNGVPLGALRLTAGTSTAVKAGFATGSLLGIKYSSTKFVLWLGLSVPAYTTNGLPLLVPAALNNWFVNPATKTRAEEISVVPMLVSPMLCVTSPVCGS